MTLGDKPDLSIHAHPVTRKVWMKHIYKSVGTAEIFEDGYVIYFNEDGLSNGAERFMSQTEAVRKLSSKGYYHD